MQKKKTKKANLGFAGAITVLFVLLKFIGAVSWSWLWVLSPLWITAMFFAVIFGAILIGGRIKKGRW